MCLTVRVQMCTQSVHDLQWFPSGRCYYRNRANSLTDKGDPEEVCPSAERKSSLRRETGIENRSFDRMTPVFNQESFQQCKRFIFRRGVLLSNLLERVVTQVKLTPHELRKHSWSYASTSLMVNSPTISRSVSGSFLKSLRKSSFRCLYVGLRTWGWKRKKNLVFASQLACTVNNHGLDWHI